jgi:Tfp pilus assembly protein PilN
MINLLPYDRKKQTNAARLNVILVRYLILIAVAIVLLTIIAGAIYVVLVRSKLTAESATSSNENKANGYSNVQNEANTFRANLQQAQIIFSQSVSYSNVMIAIAHVLPPGVVIDSLALSPATIGVPITLQANAANNADALLLKKNFSSSPLFSNVSIQSLSSATAGDTTAYPISITLNITINKTAAAS